MGVLESAPKLVSADGYVEPHPPHSKNVIGALLRSESEGKDWLDAPSKVDDRSTCARPTYDGSTCEGSTGNEPTYKDSI